MKHLRIAANVTLFLGIISVFALILLYLALTDIGHNEPDATLEWYVAGICMIFLVIFTFSVFVTLALLFKNLKSIQT